MKQVLCAVRRNRAQFAHVRYGQQSPRVVLLTYAAQYDSPYTSCVTSYNIPCSVQSYERNNFVLWHFYFTCKERNWLTANTMARKWLKHKRTVVIFPQCFYIQQQLVCKVNSNWLFTKKISVCFTLIYITIYTNRYKIMYSLLIMKTVLQKTFPYSLFYIIRLLQQRRFKGFDEQSCVEYHSYIIREFSWCLTLQTQNCSPSCKFFPRT
jgi:hypothetical protein